MNLDDWRSRINELDNQILDLLNQRAEAALRIGAGFDSVERGRADVGVVPVENSTEGAVNVTLDRLVDSDAVICGEVYLDIAQHLLSRAGALSEIKRVASHPQGLAQCRAWLAE